MEILQQIATAIAPYIVMVVTAVVGYWASQIKKKYDEKIDTDVKKQVVKDTVNYVQQVYETLQGPEKLEKAIQTASEWLQEKGITITEAELTILIESAIKAAKNSWKSEEKLPEPKTDITESE